MSPKLTFHEKPTVSVTGLGYVGLPLAVALAKHVPVVGFDNDARRIEELRQGRDRTREVEAERLRACAAHWSADPAALRECVVHLVTVPTPIDTHKRPDFGPLLSALETIAAALKPGDVVVYESTVYPGATEEICVPVLERISGLRFNRDFFCGYSPERINPGDRQHTLATIQKVVAGSTAEVTEFLAWLYGKVVEVGIFRASSIRVAEAAKVIENTQRDLNIALMNELSLIFHRLGVDTLEVLEAAGTKWNFLPSRPGLVGGHCIGVDPYYLTHKAQEVGYQPEVILAGRRINDSMALFVAHECVRLMIAHDRLVKGGRVAILGVTFKENCPDTRNSKVMDLMAELKRYGVEVYPVAEGFQGELKLIEELRDLDAVVAAVAHDIFRVLEPAKVAQWMGRRGGRCWISKGCGTRRLCERLDWSRGDCEWDRIGQCLRGLDDAFKSTHFLHTMIKGQKVVCVDDVFPPGIEKFYTALPKKGVIYVVRDVSLGVNWKGEPGEVAITLVGLENPCSDSPPYPERAFNAERFRPLPHDYLMEHDEEQVGISAEQEEEWS